MIYGVKGLVSSRKVRVMEEVVVVAVVVVVVPSMRLSSRVLRMKPEAMLSEAQVL